MGTGRRSLGDGEEWRKVAKERRKERRTRKDEGKAR